MRSLEAWLIGDSTYSSRRCRSNLSTSSRVRSEMKFNNIRTSLISIDQLCGTRISDMNDLQYAIKQNMLFRASAALPFTTPRNAFYTLDYIWSMSKCVLNGLLQRRFDLDGIAIRNAILHFEYPLLFFEYYLDITTPILQHSCRRFAMMVTKQFRELLRALEMYPTAEVVVAAVSLGVCARETALKTLYFEGQGAGTIGIPPYEFCASLKKKQKGDVLVTLFALGRQLADGAHSTQRINYSKSTRWARHVLYPTKWTLPAMMEMERLQRQKQREFLDIVKWFRQDSVQLRKSGIDRCSTRKTT